MSATLENGLQVQQMDVGDWMPEDLQKQVDTYNSLVEQASKAFEKAQGIDTESETLTGAQLRKAMQQKSDALFDALTAEIQALELFKKMAPEAQSALQNKQEGAEHERRQVEEQIKKELQDVGLDNGSASYVAEHYRFPRLSEASAVVHTYERKKWAWRQGVVDSNTALRELKEQRSQIRQAIESGD